MKLFQLVPLGLALFSLVISACGSALPGAAPQPDSPTPMVKPEERSPTPLATIARIDRQIS